MGFILKKTMPEILTKTEISLSKPLINLSNYGSFTPAYLFTTENISGYMDSLDMEGKDVLTVIGSGDHVLNAILKGTKKIDAFDISIYAIMLYYLKEAAVKALTYQEFIEFFFKVFNSIQYEKIRPHLEKDALIFWDFVCHRIKINDLFYTYMFRRNYYSSDPTAEVRKLSFASNYLTERNYNRLKRRISDCQITCYECECKDLDEIMSMYDYMFFSNIIQYQIDDELTEFRSAISRYFTKLKIGGEIKVGYFYGYIYKNMPNLRRKSLLKEYEVEPIPAFKLPFEDDDYVLTLRRKK